MFTATPLGPNILQEKNRSFQSVNKNTISMDESQSDRAIQRHKDRRFAQNEEKVKKGGKVNYLLYFCTELKILKNKEFLLSEEKSHPCIHLTNILSLGTLHHSQELVIPHLQEIAPEIFGI